MEYTDVRARYERLRNVAFPLVNKVLPDYLAEDSLNAAGKRLGVMKGRTLVVDTIDQVAVVMDHAFYDCLHDGTTAVQRLLAERRPAPGSDEDEFLKAMGKAYFSLFQMKRAVPGTGVHVNDILHEEEVFLADMGFSHTTHPGIILASRVLPYEGFVMTSGAALPVTPKTLDQIIDALESHPSHGMGMRDRPLKEREQWIGRLLHICIRNKASEHVVYQNVGRYAPVDGCTPEQGRVPVGATGQVGRNDPCPCGSGRKYKKCCGSRARPF